MSDAGENGFTGAEIAVIGMSGRFPHSPDIEAFWQNLLRGNECISFFARQDLIADGVPRAEVEAQNYVPASGSISDSICFDAEFFNMPPREAQLIDPQNRVFLECAWNALEDSGYDPEVFSGAIGVYAGKSLSEYLLFALVHAPHVLKKLDLFQFFLGNDKDFLATQVSYKLNLRGPSVGVQTACSTSLAAVHFACQGLLAGDCDIALAGGVSLRFPERHGYTYQTSGITSPDGHCRTFDANAQGTVPGSGVGIVALRRLADALEARDPIRAVIRGSAINNDGSHKLSYTAPSVPGQAEVIRAAYAVAEVNPSTVDFIETHGTATSMGDAVEVAALNEVFQAVPRQNRCVLGALKTNIGHLDAAAGVAGLIKTILALQHGELPPTVHFQRPNLSIDLENSAFTVYGTPQPWPSKQRPRRAGVSSFGMGGTNVHLVLEEWREAQSTSVSQSSQVLPLSARSEGALRRRAADLAQWLSDHEDANLEDVAFTLQTGRRAFTRRFAVTARDTCEAELMLSDMAGSSQRNGITRAGVPAITFMFPGQGSQFAGMGAQLYQRHKVFRETVDECCSILRKTTGVDLLELMCPREEHREQAELKLRETSVAQPALFAIEVALAKLWMAWGISPQAMIGHSVGEYAAACIAGVVSLEDGMQVVTSRGQLMAALPRGAMLAVALPEADAIEFLNDGISLAAINGPVASVFSGPLQPIAALEQKFRRRELLYHRLQTSHGFHSAMVDPMMGEFRKKVAEVDLLPPRLPYVSCLTGRWITEKQATDPDYWVSHLRQTMRFSDGLETVIANPQSVLLEVGPGSVLSGLARRFLQSKNLDSERVLQGIPKTGERTSESQTLATQLGQLWSYGAQPSWVELHRTQPCQRLSLPTYPFERKLYSLFRDTQVEPVIHNEVSSQIRAGVGSRPSSAPDYVAPASDAELTLARIWEQLLGIAPVGRRDHFFDLGGTSLVSLGLISAVRSHFQQEMQLSDVFQHPTLASMAGALSAPKPPLELGRALLSLQADGVAHPLFLVHPVGGTVVCYRELVRHLGTERPVFGIQAKSLKENAEPHASLEEMASSYLQLMREVQPDPPYFLGGWSMGGVVAFEVARQLAEKGHTAIMLAVLDSHPLLYRELISDAIDIDSVSALLVDGLPRHVGDPNGPFRRLLQLAGITGEIPAELDARFVRTLIATYRHNLSLLKRYMPGRYPGNILVFRATEQPDEALPDLGWGQLVAGNVEIFAVEGDHQTIMQEPGLGRIAQTLRARLESYNSDYAATGEHEPRANMVVTVTGQVATVSENPLT